MHLLAEHRASRLLISGVNPASAPSTCGNARHRPRPAMMPAASDLGHALATPSATPRNARWVREHRFASLIVVTSAYHIAAPLGRTRPTHAGRRARPYPIANPNSILTPRWDNAEAFSLLVREYGKSFLTARVLRFRRKPPATAHPDRHGANRPMISSLAHSLNLAFLRRHRGDAGWRRCRSSSSCEAFGMSVVRTGRRCSLPPRDNRRGPHGNPRCREYSRLSAALVAPQAPVVVEPSALIPS